MATSEPYDWVDDEELDMPAVVQRLEALEPARVVTSTPPQTSAGSVVVIHKSVFGHSQGKPTFA